MVEQTEFLAYNAMHWFQHPPHRRFLPKLPPHRETHHLRCTHYPRFFNPQYSKACAIISSSFILAVKGPRAAKTVTICSTNWKGYVMVFSSVLSMNGVDMNCWCSSGDAHRCHQILKSTNHLSSSKFFRNWRCLWYQELSRIDGIYTKLFL